mmetsp:Transcript_119106/g.273156  ORF Transcript_119106/g.273156 Transcript_119106/m.273156 type:complete len:217 (-) Transcript_119106:1313-1963(-)
MTSAGQDSESILPPISQLLLSSRRKRRSWSNPYALQGVAPFLWGDYPTELPGRRSGIFSSLAGEQWILDLARTLSLPTWNSRTKRTLRKPSTGTGRAGKAPLSRSTMLWNGEMLAREEAKEAQLHWRMLGDKPGRPLRTLVVGLRAWDHPTPTGSPQDFHPAFRRDYQECRPVCHRCPASPAPRDAYHPVSHPDSSAAFLQHLQPPSRPCSAPCRP